MGPQLINFFGEGNNWNLDKIQNGDYPQPLQKHLSDLLVFAQKKKAPYILPRLDANKQLWFYIVSNDLLELNEISSMVKAYLGSSYIIFDPVEYKDSDDYLEQIVIELSPHGFCRFSIPVGLNRSKDKVYWVLNTLGKLLQQYYERPRLASNIKRPVGTILRNFFTACYHEKGDSAFDYYTELRSHQAVSNRNLLSLELQALFASSRWNDILNHPRLPDLLATKIPKRLQSQLLITIYKKVIKSFDFEKLDLDFLKRDLLSFQYLFFTPPDIPRSEEFLSEWKVWGIGASVFGNVRVTEACAELIERNWLAKLCEWANLPIANKAIQRRFDSNDVSSLIDMAPSVEAGGLLFKEALSADSTVAKKLYQRLLDYPKEIFEQLVSSTPIASLWKTLESEYGDRNEISSWSNFFEYLVANNAEEKIDYLNRVLIEQCGFWGKEKDLHELDKAISSLSDNSASLILRDFLPHFVTWMDKHEVKLSASSIEHLMLILVIDEKNALEDLLLCNSMLDLLLHQPFTKLHYQSVLEVVSQCWSNVESVNALPACLEIIEVLIDGPCLDENARLSFWSQVEGFALSHWKRLDRLSTLVCQDVAKILLGSSKHLPSSEPVIETDLDSKVDLTGKRLAIYSLTESAALRASNILKEMYPGLEVKTNSDKTATEALKTLIKSADYFIFAAKSAAHQAFYPLTKYRNDIIYPTGKGSSSIVGAFIVQQTS